ncbi:hypothetical protein V5O48_006694 [Marasmius crinis-equi]|uniref:Uncharacterized protein n=1 Tax=Marasmius crinis-equi TaxID=585013 RepID=A0ABR3FJP7_9AGAR
MPFHIDHNGLAPISTFLQVKDAKKTIGAPEPNDSLAEAPVESNDPESQETIVVTGDRNTTSSSASSETLVSTISTGPLASDSDLPNRYTSTFRGRTIHGLAADVPEEYTGVMLRAEGVTAEQKQKQKQMKEKEKLKAAAAKRRAKGKVQEGGRRTRNSRREEPEEVMDVDEEDEEEDEEKATQEKEQEEERTRNLVPAPQFSSFVLWHPDIPVDTGKDEYFGTISEWMKIARATSIFQYHHHGTLAFTHSTSSRSASHNESDPESRGTKSSRLIPKPHGDAGRPGNGGYTLEKALGWSKPEYETIREYVKEKALKKLNVSLAFAEQPANVLQSIRDAAVRRYSYLAHYEGLWVIDDIIRSVLKYEKAKIKKVQTRELLAWYKASEDRAVSIASDTSSALSRYTSDSTSTNISTVRDNGKSGSHPAETSRADNDLEEEIVVEQILQDYDYGDSDSESDLSDLDSGDDFDPETDEESIGIRKIPKPRGDAGRLGSGGYNLKETLNWPSLQYDQVWVGFPFLLFVFVFVAKTEIAQSFVKEQVLRELDWTLPFAQQPEEKIRLIRRVCLDQFSFLADYHKLWVVDDMIRSHIRYKKQAIKRKRDAELLERCRKRRAS